MNFLTKELVDTFSWIYWGKENVKSVRINGRLYYKTGRETSAIYVGNLYKVYDPSVKSFKYVMMIGAAIQHPCDSKINKEDGYEIANEHAMTEPIMTITLNHKIDNEDFLRFVKSYEATREVDFVKTKAEVEEYSRSLYKNNTLAVYDMHSYNR